MAERQIGYRRSSLVLSAHLPVANDVPVPLLNQLIIAPSPCVSGQVVRKSFSRIRHRNALHDRDRTGKTPFMDWARLLYFLNKNTTTEELI